MNALANFDVILRHSASFEDIAKPLSASETPASLETAMTTYRNMMIPVRTTKDLLTIARSGEIVSGRADLTSDEKKKIRAFRKIQMEADVRTIERALRRKRLGISYNHELLGEAPPHRRRR